MANDQTTPPLGLAESRARLRQAARAQYSPAGEPTLLESNVAFVDLLGFSELMKCFSDGELRKLLTLMRANVDFFDVFEAYEGPDRVVTFSDNVCACRPVDHEEIDGGLGWHIIAAGQFQRNLTLNGYFVRGGVTVGPVYADEGTVMGGALVRAYTLEQETKQPRVALDASDVLTFALGAIEYQDPHAALQNRCALVDQSDGTVFVNYLEFLTEADDDVEFYQSLAFHRDLITDRLQTFRENAAVLPKYEWVARYHNWMCSVQFKLPDYQIKASFNGHHQQDSFKPLIEWLETETDWDISALRKARFGSTAT